MDFDLTDSEWDRVNRAVSALQARVLEGDEGAARDLAMADDLLRERDRHILKHAQGVLDDEEERARAKGS